MHQELQFTASPEQAYNKDELLLLIARKCGIHESRIKAWWLLNRSVDARQKTIKINLRIKVFIDEQAPVRNLISFQPYQVKNAKPVIIVGSGPAGLFAALRLIERGYKPLILERGKEIGERKKDVALISREHLIHPDSNYCFGEGGAGTFSDGKLYTRSWKRGDVMRVLELFYHFGADESVLYEAHPHIGTDLLPQVIRNMRKTILDCGGEILFSKRVIDFILENDRIRGVLCHDGDRITGESVLLATGHSARDIYELMHKREILIESKDFAVGVRVEHPQSLIDSIQYHSSKRNQWLPAAAYSLAEQVNGRGVFSFCMCPGGFVVPSATMPDEVVVNGMSSSLRNSPYANSAIVCEVRSADLAAYHKYDVLCGMYFQKELEILAQRMAAGNQKAPAQRLTDFLQNKTSQSLPKSSYFPGIVSSDLHSWLPNFVKDALQSGFPQFDKKMRGFVTNDAIILGVETRTSSPVRIPRDPGTRQHPSIKGLYPCGEGSGYAGGIVSSAMDGINSAEKV